MVTRTICGDDEVLITVKTVFSASLCGWSYSTSKYGRRSVAAAYVPMSQLAAFAVAMVRVAAGELKARSSSAAASVILSRDDGEGSPADRPLPLHRQGIPRRRCGS